MDVRSGMPSGAKHTQAALSHPNKTFQLIRLPPLLTFYLESMELLCYGLG